MAQQSLLAFLKYLVTLVKKNAISGVTGAISYRKGYYMQLIEGEADVIDQLFSNIKTDKRHTAVTVIIETMVSQRSFPLRNMMLVNSFNKEAKFIDFVRRNSREFATLPDALSTILAKFFELDIHVEGMRKTGHLGFEGKHLMLRAWPNFALIQKSPGAIEICAKLTKRPRSYSSLVISLKSLNQDQIDQLLYEFESLDLLTITSSPNNTETETDIRKPDGFYSKMKDFLRFK